MKIIDRGLVGKQISCPRCQCVSELETTDTWQKRHSRRPPEMQFYVNCPQCSCEIIIVKEMRVPVWPRSAKTVTEAFNFV